MHDLIIPTVLAPGAHLPVYVKEGDVAADIHAMTVIKLKRDDPWSTPDPEVVVPIEEYIGGQVILQPRSHRVFGTGVSMELPPGWKIEVKARSGTSAFEGIEVGGGLIDNNYRGELRVILHNHTDKPFKVKPGDRIAQLCVERYYVAKFEPVTALAASVRGADGLGSSGVGTVKGV